MSKLSKMMAKSNLKTGIDKALKARKATPEKADKLYQVAYKSFASAIQHVGTELPEGSEALYRWGVALYHQGLIKPEAEADTLYRGACEKFDGSHKIDPTNSHTLNDWGVTLMARAQAENVSPNHDLYEQAREKFLATEDLEPGLAAYNLACLHSIRGSFGDCKKCLEVARDNGYMPDGDELETDTDLTGARNQEWFQGFLKSLLPEPEEKPETQKKSEPKSKKQKSGQTGATDPEKAEADQS